MLFESEMEVGSDDVPFDVPDSPPVEFRLCEIVPQAGGNGFFVLRPYQHSCVDRFYESLNHVQSTLIVSATGTGKTVAMAEIAMRWPDHLGRVLIIAHREELIDQAAEKIGLHMDEATGIEMGDRRESQHPGAYGKMAKVLVASIQTLAREKRRGRFRPQDFGLVLVDESHHAPAKSYRTVLSYFLQNPQCRIGGVTATPKRADAAAMGDIFHDVCFELDIVEAIEEGWLVDIEQKIVVVEGLDFSKCRTTGGDLNNKDLESQMLGGLAEKIVVTDQLTPLQREQIEEQEKMLHAVVGPTIRESAGRPTLVFCVTKVHAERMTEVFNRHPGIVAEFVTDETPKDLRKDIIRQFNAGSIQILVGVGVFTEGFDSRVDVVVMARPTKSEALYRQCVGRGTRPIKNIVDKYDTPSERREAIANSAKPSMTVLDFVGNAGKHSLCSVTDILGGEYTEDVIQAAKLQLRTGTTEVVSELLKKTKEELDEKKRQFLLEKAERERLAKERAEEERLERAAEHARREKIRADVQYRTESVKLTGAVVPEQVGVGMFRGGATDQQVKYLIRLGIREETACKASRGQAGAMIDKISSQTGAKFVMRFGKYAGNELGKLPSSYLDWAAKNMSDPTFQQNLTEMRSTQPGLPASIPMETPF